MHGGRCADGALAFRAPAGFAHEASTLLALMLVACGSQPGRSAMLASAATHGTPPHADAGSADASSVVASSGPITGDPSIAGLPACTGSIGSCPAQSFGIWQELLNASEFGAGAHFVSMGGLGLLVAIADGSFRVVRLRQPTWGSASGAAYASWDFPSQAMEPIAITEANQSGLGSGPPGSLFVLTCDAARAQCSVWRSDVDTAQPPSWQQMTLPEGLEPQGLVLDRAQAPGQVCAYGRGLACWSDSWQQAIAATNDLRIRAVAFGAFWSLAVGDHGRWFKRERDDADHLGAWEEQAPLGDAALSSVSLDGRGGVIVGEGRLQAAVGMQSPFFDCSIANDLAALILDRGTNGLAYAVTDAGQTLQHAPPTGPYCAYQTLPLTGAVIATEIVPCSAALNPRVLTAAAVFGQSECIEVP